MVNELSVSIAQAAMEKINLGDMIEAEIEGNLQTLKVLKKDAYSLTLQGKTNHILCPINWTTIYKGIDEMRIPTEAAATGPKPRGRPRKSDGPSGPQAPTGHPVAAPAAAAPANQWLPPGSPDPRQQPPAAAPTWAKPAAPPADNGSIPAETDLLEFAKKAIADACSELSQDLLKMVEAIVSEAEANAENEAPPPAEPEPKTFTCGDCKHINFAGDICDHWKVKPPMKVIVNAKTNCPAFEADAILDDEIPF